MRVTIRHNEAPLLIREEAKMEAEKQQLFHNDFHTKLESCLYFFDFKYRGYWVSSIEIANDHSYMVIDVIKA